MEELLFYTVDKNYIKYLSEFESHVSYNKDEIGHSRPYLGIVLKIENYKYFVPLYSYKEHYQKYKNNPSFFFVYDRKNNPLAIIKFSAMIPVVPAEGRRIHDSREVQRMAKCEFCDKGVTFGIKVSHSHRRSNRSWKPNVKRVKAIVNGENHYLWADKIPDLGPGFPFLYVKASG